MVILNYYFFIHLYIILNNFFFSEPVDGGIEITLKLRLSTTLADVKLPVYSKDTIGIAKKKLQVIFIQLIHKIFFY